MEQLEISMEDALNITQHQVSDKHKELLTALADLLWPVLRERIAGHVKTVVEDKFIGLDRDVINAAISQYVIDHDLIDGGELDQRLSDGIEDKIESGISYWVDHELADSVRDIVKHNLSFSIDVD